MRTAFVAGALLVSLALLPARALAQAEPGDPHPLRPADTSSPRDTLKSFLTNAAVALEAWKRDDQSPARFRARERAIQTLDFGTTPHGASAGVRSERLLLLKEILDRIELPPWEDIPGDREVADGSITRWTIPNTEIRIERVESGRRAGEFLFSAATAERLDRYYRRVKDLPYKPGALPGIYDAFRQSDRSVFAHTRVVRNRLQPIDASNPRSTLEGFLDSVNRAHALVVGANAALRQDPAAISHEQALEMESAADNLLRRARGALDLSEVPEAIRESAGIEAVLQLKEVLDRLPLPPLESVPGPGSVAAHRQRSDEIPFRWRIPDTRIELVEIIQGDRAGDFLVSAATIRRIGRFYDELKDLPYRSAGLAGLTSDYLSPGTSEGFYDAFISTPGHLVPLASPQARLIESLPQSLKVVRGGQTLWQWIGLALCLAVVPFVAFVVFRVVKRVTGGLASPWDDWLAILMPAIVAAIVLRFERFIDADLNVTGGVLSIVTTGAESIVLAMLAWASFLFFRAFGETVVASPRIVRVSEQSLNASLVRITARLVGFLVGAWIVVAGIRSIGLDVVPLLAGLGVGGLAVALAAQTTFANFIGSLVLFANKPVRVGDFCRYGDQIGTVEEIGLHSTRIRSLERTIVTVPNAEFSQMQLDNISKRDQRLFRTTLKLRYETTPGQLRYVLAQVRALLLGHPKVTPDPARARFVGYGEYSKDIEIFAYLRCQDQSVFLAIQEDLLLRIEDIISEAGTSFAVPAQVEYQAPDPGLDAERGAEAEARVGQWRSEDRLPFPEFDAEERRELADSLEYPPEGSPDYRPRGPSESEPEEPAARSRSRWFRRPR